MSVVCKHGAGGKKLIWRMLAKNRACAIVAAMGTVIGCSNTILEQTDKDNRISIEGEFCTRSSSELQLPVKVLFLVDASLSMVINDPKPPNGHSKRASAVNEVLQTYCEKSNYSFGIIQFATNEANIGISYLTGDFVPCNPEVSVEKQFGRYINQLDSPFGNTPYLAVLDKAKEAINEDIAKMTPEMQQTTRYAIVFFSDGEPCVYDPNNLGKLKGEDFDLILKKIDDIMSLEKMVGGISFSTSYLENTLPSQCNIWSEEISGPPALLQAMANHGRGVFQKFSSSIDISFLELIKGAVYQTFTLFDVVATNRSAKLSFRNNKLMLLPDSDTDGLSDFEEIEQYHTDPLLADTDNDGCRDGIEIRKGFWPLSGITETPVGWSDPCKVPEGSSIEHEQLRMDTDGDFLFDREEFLVLQTSKVTPDSDGDGLPDGLEAFQGSNPHNNDGAIVVDQDADGVSDRYEIKAHTIPSINEEKEKDDAREKYAYVYEKHLSNTKENGQRCYTFRVDNIGLVETLESESNSAGENLIDLYFIQHSDGLSKAPPFIERATYRQKFFLSGAREPDRSLITFDNQDLVLLGVPQ